MQISLGLSKKLQIGPSAENSKDFIVKLPYSFSLRDTLECGQSFRWSVHVNADGTEFYGGMVGDNYVYITQPDENTLLFHDTDLASFNNLWNVYFDLERDYESLKSILSRDAVLSSAMDFCGGIRVLRQPRWETLCSYIISQNNNIPRIKSLIHKLCASFGNPIKIMRPDGTRAAGHSFPEPTVLSNLNDSDLEKLGFGYRARYLVYAAKAVAARDLNLDSVAQMPIDEARAELRKLVGVGPKVAECTLLYGFGRDEAFPVDTWIKTVMSKFYPAGLPEFVSPYAGIAQIYLFHYVRNMSK
jgi:N-glycosylase/DNA lyase